MWAARHSSLGIWSVRTGSCHIEGTPVLIVDRGRMEDMLVLKPLYENVGRQWES